MKILRLVLAVALLSVSVAGCTSALPTAPAEMRLDGDGTGFGGGGTR